jgi:outer membrane protein assembly factor BamE (lipoprotein component of BamABCDE complex)
MRLAPLLLLAAALGGCAQLRSHQGYVVDADLVNSVQPGVDTRESVGKVLGQPTFASQFGARDWYYVSRNSKNYAFNRPHPTDQLTVEISFAANDTVTAVRRMDAQQVASVRPDGKTTPTLGRKRGLFQDLFGNIGTVGAAGIGGEGGQGGGGGGGRTQP